MIANHDTNWEGESEYLKVSISKFEKFSFKLIKWMLIRLKKKWSNINAIHMLDFCIVVWHRCNNKFNQNVPRQPQCSCLNLELTKSNSSWKNPSTSSSPSTPPDHRSTHVRTSTTNDIRHERQTHCADLIVDQEIVLPREIHILASPSNQKLNAGISVMMPWPEVVVLKQGPRTPWSGTLANFPIWFSSSCLTASYIERSKKAKGIPVSTIIPPLPSSVRSCFSTGIAIHLSPTMISWSLR